MQFCFQLMPSDEIPPWGAEQDQLDLSWYGLTFGWFWIEIGGHELFRYTQAATEHWSRQAPATPLPALLYEDYQVARYWEDLLTMFPAIIHPLPSDLAARVADAQGWNEWQKRLERRWTDSPDETFRDLYHAANDWWHLRTWSAYHLAHPPRLWLWRVADMVHVRWDNREVTVDDIPVWEAAQGEATVPIVEFIAAVKSFDARFLAAMQVRVEEIRAGWTRPNISVDVVRLEASQQNAALGVDLEKVSPLIEWEFTWDEVRSAMNALEQNLYRRAGEGQVREAAQNDSFT